MPPNREYLRTPVDAASTAGRFGRDFKLAARLHAQGLEPYKGRVPVFLVDLATKGSLTEPHGLQLRHSKLFNTQAAVSAYGMHRDIEAFERLHRPNNVVHIVLRPTLDLAQAEKKGGQKLLDKDGRCPIGNLRAGQRAFNNSVQRAIAELERRELFTPLLVARHLLPFQGGANFDVHAHIVGQVKPDDGWDVQDYLSANFGSDRIWISSLMNPGETRSFSRTSNYPVWGQADQDWNEVNDENLKEFFEQSSGLRSVDALGPFRDFRAGMDSSSNAATTDDGDHSPDAEMFDGGQSPDAVDARDSSASSSRLFETGAHPGDDEVDREDDNRGAAAADISSLLANDPARTPILYGCHFAWIGLTRRYVAQVGNYTTFDELQQHYDLDAAIAFAQHHVEDTHAYLFKPVIHENLSGPTTVVTGSEAAGKSRPTAEPQRDAGPANPYPSTPENESSAPTDLNSIERHGCSDVSSFGLAGLTLELTVRSEHGPATAILRVGLPAPSREQWPQRSRIAG